MDLKELQRYQGVRHPWEVARVAAAKKILSPHLHQGMKILDVGCGDGFVSRTLFAGLRRAEITAVDINLSDDQIRELRQCGGSITYLRKPPAAVLFELLLLMDVIEHVQDDEAFLRGVVEGHLARRGKVLLTVPSFQALFGAHDVALGHYRRYSLKELERVAKASGLTVLCSGYLFATLLLPRLAYNRLLQGNPSSAGVGNWEGGKAVTSLLEFLLKTDNAILVAAAGSGLKIPGLSAWALAEKA